MSGTLIVRSVLPPVVSVGLNEVEIPPGGGGPADGWVENATLFWKLTTDAADSSVNVAPSMLV